MEVQTRQADTPVMMALLYLAALVWPAIAVAGLAQNAPEVGEVRRLFIEIASASALPPARQADRLRNLYRDICPPLNERYVAHLVFAPLPRVADSDSPQRKAELLEQAGGWPVLADAGRRLCWEFMRAHSDAATLLARDGLQGSDRASRLWALRVIGEVRAAALFDAVVSALVGPDGIYAADALRSLDDPRAIPLLIRQSPEDPTRFFETLRSLQRNRPAHQLLLDLLRSGDATVRWRAAYALVESRDPILMPHIPRLVSDPSAEVRRLSGYMGTAFADP
jgi:hypothetical protein